MHAECAKLDLNLSLHSLISYSAYAKASVKMETILL